MKRLENCLCVLLSSVWNFSLYHDDRNYIYMTESNYQCATLGLEEYRFAPVQFYAFDTDSSSF